MAEVDTDGDAAAQEGGFAFPCTIPVKVLGAVDDTFVPHTTALIATHVGADALGDISHRLSRNGRFIALTVQVRVQDREQLEAIYRDLAASDKVLMTL